SAHRPVPAVRPGPALADPVLRVARFPDVPDLVLVGHARDRVRVLVVEYLELHRVADAVLAAVLAIAAVRRAGDAPDLRDLISAGLHDRVPRRALQEPLAVPRRR